MKTCISLLLLSSNICLSSRLLLKTWANKTYVIHIQHKKKTIVKEINKVHNKKVKHVNMNKGLNKPNFERDYQQDQSEPWSQRGFGPKELGFESVTRVRFPTPGVPLH